VQGGVAVPLVRAASAVLEDNSLGLLQKLLCFAEVEHSVVCLDLNVNGDSDGALKITRLGSQFLGGVVTFVSLPHLGRHGLTCADEEI